MLHEQAVVPTAVEEHHLAGGGHEFDVTLDVELGFLTVAGCGQGNGAENPRADAFGDAFDHPALAGRVTTLEEDHHAQPLVAYPGLQFDQFGLQAVHLRLVEFAVQLVPLGVDCRDRVFVFLRFAFCFHIRSP
ncbi:hypothetical protein DESC_200029 [Desulfosarcina cetonica]|nr:hypothetical protein DESC_200029 [Desulfosarcina cetonica]